MKFLKYVVVITLVLGVIPTVSHAQTVQAVGGGSSAIFLEMGQGAATASGAGNTNTPCVWTGAKGLAGLLARDNRTTPALGAPTDEAGNIWITWSAGTGAGATCANPVPPNVNIYSYMQLDSVVGDKCFFEGDSATATGCVQVLTVTLPNTGANLLPGIADTSLPSLIQGAVNGQHFSYAGTDIRPEDGKFAVYRMLQQCGSIVYRNPYDLEYRLTYGLGYQTANAGIGQQVHSAFSSALFNVLDFSIAGTADPISGFPTPASFSVTPIGAQPIIVAVAPASDSAGIGAVNDINGFTLALFYEGILGRTTDMVGPTSALPVQTLVREPLSGTYNTFEFSVPNSSQFHTSQDDIFCSGTSVFSTTMNIATANSTVPGAARMRVIGTGQMTTELQAATTSAERLGYFFWSGANAAGLTNVKYVTLDGVDPLLDAYGSSGGVTYGPGVLPQSGGVAPTPPLTAVSFKNLNAGDYSAWSAVRVVGAPGSVPVATLVKSLGTIDSTQHDYITLANLNVWHSHFPIYGIVGSMANGPTINPLTPGDLCLGGTPEAGGDAGGANVLKKVNLNFCADYSNPAGLVNKTN